jgi:putative CocE/NonD family hydrolase
MAAAALALSVASSPAAAAPARASSTAITPMTPDVVASYEGIRPDADYVRREVMIPMRDGVKLYTVIFMKKGAAKAPMLLSRTPYDAKGSTSRTASQTLTEVLPAMDAEFVGDGYIRVYQDIRGMHHSEGEFVMTRPIIGPLNHTKVDESTDAYDTIDWLVKHVPESNGRVGVVGSSYLGFTTLMAEINPHPALKAAAPQSPMVDTWKGDDDFHNGAFRVGTLDYIVEMSTGKGDAGAKIPRGAGDDYTAYLQAGSIGDFARKWGIDQYPAVRKVMENPAYTDFWSLQAVDKWMATRPLTVPTMLMLGQWDQEDSYGAPAVYRALEPKDTNNDMVSLVIGPWRHSGVNHYGYDLGALTFNGDTAREFRVRYLKPFFDHYLKDGPDPHTPPVLTYATGVNQWNVSPKWPMGAPTPLYLDAGGRAGFASPGAEGHDEYVSDPANPVPFLPRPIDMAASDQWKTWLVHDQRFVDGRPDVISYQTAPLNKPVHIMGAPQVNLFAATSGTDSDWVVKLIDVAPDTTPESADQGSKPANPGYELPIGIEIYRGRYVHGLATPAALTPGKVENFRFDLPNVDHVFLPGHRIMVQVQSSLFPLYDRNPQTYVSNIFNAPAGSYRAATQSIFHGGGHASAVLLPIVQDGASVASR